MSNDLAGFSFQISDRDGDARCGEISTPNGRIETPAFMPVATFGAVRGISMQELEQIGAQIALSNTYHLHERPGETRIQDLGGLHGFTSWRKPWLTDSGGYQITSLAKQVAVSEEGVVFRSPIDGGQRQLTPENTVAIQQALGSDIAMVLDECRPPEQVNEAVVARTHRWALRARAAHKNTEQALFGIVQGGVQSDLRRESALRTGEIHFDGFAHGGLGLGESIEARQEVLQLTHALLPGEKVRYLMGLGLPQDLLYGVAAGVDLFDCVLPTRNGRHGVAFTSNGILRLRNAAYADDSNPPDINCDCPTCSHYSRAYLRHLLHVGEQLGGKLIAIHNLRFYLSLLQQARQAIREKRFAHFFKTCLESFSR